MITVAIIDAGGVVDRKTDRIAWLDVGRGAAIILVIFFHATILTLQITDVHRIYLIFNQFFTPIRMPLFFTISGILGAKVIATSWSQIIVKRVALLWYVYTVWVAITLLIEIIVGHQVGPSDLFLSWIWPNAELWYLWALGLYFIVARLFRGKWQVPLLIGTFVVSVLMDHQLFQLTSIPHVKAIVYAPYFLGGAWYGRSLLKLAAHEWILFPISAGGFLSLFLANWWNLIPPVFCVCASIFGVLAGMSGAVIISRLPYVGSALAYFGRNTLPVYVSHFLILKMILFIALSVGIVALPGFSVWGALAAGGAALGLSLSLGRIVKDYNANWLFQLPPRFATRPPIMLQQPVRSFK